MSSWMKAGTVAMDDVVVALLTSEEVEVCGRGRVCAGVLRCRRVREEVVARGARMDVATMEAGACWLTSRRSKDDGRLCGQVDVAVGDASRRLR